MRLQKCLSFMDSDDAVDILDGDGSFHAGKTGRIAR